VLASLLSLVQVVLFQIRVDGHILVPRDLVNGVEALVGGPRIPAFLLVVEDRLGLFNLPQQRVFLVPHSHIVTEHPLSLVLGLNDHWQLALFLLIFPFDVFVGVDPPLFLINDGLRPPHRHLF